MKHFFIIILFFGISSIAFSQNYHLKSYVIGASSQQASNLDYKVKSTLGQPAIGKIQNQDNIAGIGFWYSLSQAPAPSNSQIIGLNQGWNIISSYLIASDPFMPSVWASIVDEVVLVKNSGGQTYIPFLEINQIGNWDVLSGYQVYMSSTQDLTINGTQVVPEDTDLSLAQGWSIISYLRTSPQSVVTSLETLTNDDALVLAKNSGGETYIPFLEINQIGNMQPGQGYQIYLSKASTLTYPANSNNKLTGLEYVTPKPKVLIPGYKSTGSNMVLVITGNAEDGSEVGVYNSNDLLIGSGVFHKNAASITIWGNDDYISEINGATPNELLSVKYLENKSSQLIDVELSDLVDVSSNKRFSDLFFTNNGFLLGKTNIESTKLEKMIVNVTPNPFVESVEISFNLNAESSVKVSLYTLDGSFVKNISNSASEIGLQTINLSGSGLASGEYNLFIEIGNERLIKKLIKIK